MGISILEGFPQGPAKLACNSWEATLVGYCLQEPGQGRCPGGQGVAGAAQGPCGQPGQVCQEPWQWRWCYGVPAPEAFSSGPWDQVSSPQAS